MPESPIMCVGHINWDVVLHTDKVPEPDFSSRIQSEHASCGGSATNTALALSSFGEDVTMFGGVGDDDYGEEVIRALEDSEVAPSVTRTDVPTTVVYAVITEDADPRYFAKNEDVGEFSLDDVDSEAWEAAEHIHLTTFSKEIGGELAQAAKDAGKTVSFNPSQGYSESTFEKIVDASDVIFLNEREGALFRDRHNFGEFASENCITITHGSAGSTSYTPDGVFHHSGFSIAEIQDTIGAGDAFVAGFLTEWLDSGDYEEALALANAAGAYAVTCTGAPDGLDEEVVRKTLAD